MCKPREFIGWLIGRMERTYAMERAAHGRAVHGTAHRDTSSPRDQLEDAAGTRSPRSWPRAGITSSNLYRHLPPVLLQRLRLPANRTSTGTNIELRPLAHKSLMELDEAQREVTWNRWLVLAPTMQGASR